MCLDFRRVLFRSLNALLTTIRNQATEIESLNKEVALMRTNILKEEAEESAKPPKEEKKVTKKAATKKTTKKVSK